MLRFRQPGNSFGSRVTGRQWVVDVYTIVFACMIAERGCSKGKFASGTHIALYLSAGLLALGFSAALRYVTAGNRVGIASRAVGPVVSR